MCGFSFALSKNNIPFKILKEMNQLIAHRGPDRERFISSSNISSFKLKNKINFKGGFRRLKILDLSNKADQPMYYENKYVILFNGEIYNYLEIKKKLENKDYKFQTKSDTEVIMAAYDCWGVDCFNYFNGMWSVILIDISKNKLIACRDRYGVKPLFYTKYNDTYFFASEIKQLLYLRKKNYVNKNELLYFLKEDIINISKKTLVKDIHQVKSGSYLIFDFYKFTLNERRWYNFKSRVIPKLKLNVYIKKTFEEAISLRLRSDVKVGIALSGGIDSSIIASIVANKKNDYKKILTFTTKSNDYLDEYEYVRSFTKKYKFKNYKINLTFKNFKKNFSTIVQQHDFPISDISVFSEWELFRLIKSKGITVNLDGHGADEQLCGYEKYFAIYVKYLFKSNKYFKIILFFMEIIHSNLKYKLRFFLSIFFNLLPYSVIKYLKFLLKWDLDMNWFKIKNNLFLKNKEYKFKNENFSQFFLTSLPKQLYWSDINSMSHSIETRSPYLDYNFVETVLPLNIENKINGITSKKILREIFGYLLPKKILNRNFKVGFSCPGEKWIKKNSKEIKNMFEYYFNYLEGVLNNECKKESLNIINGKSPYRSWIWKVIFLGAWFKYHQIKIDNEN
jgi:asparagine synthase (glutamine-hydrolysing)